MFYAGWSLASLWSTPSSQTSALDRGATGEWKQNRLCVISNQLMDARQDHPRSFHRALLVHAGVDAAAVKEIDVTVKPDKEYNAAQVELLVIHQTGCTQCLLDTLFTTEAREGAAAPPGGWFDRALQRMLVS